MRPTVEAAPGRLPRSALLEVIRQAPLVSIDLIVRDPADRVLVGLRTNEPARGTWFVPGGMVAKNETLDRAFARISRRELGIRAERSSARFIGVYEHFYDSNFGEKPGFGTHYVVLAHEVRIGDPDLVLPDDQHEQLRWLDLAMLASDPSVHENSRVYARALA